MASLETLNQRPELQAKLDENEGEKAEILEHLRRAVNIPLRKLLILIISMLL